MKQRQATIIYNPASGRRGRRAESAAEMARLLAERGIATTTRATRAPADATRLAREAIAEGADILVSYGGDGTLNEVIQAMVGQPAVLAVWAGGTANVVARDLQLPADKERLADIIATGKTLRIALGAARSGDSQRSLASGVKSLESGDREQGTGNREEKEESRGQVTGCRERIIEGEEDGEKGEMRQGQRVEARQESFTPITASPPHLFTSSAVEAADSRLQTPDARLPPRYFVMFAGIGLDAAIAKNVNARLKRRAGELAFWLSGLQHLARVTDGFVVEIGDRQYESGFTLIGKGKGYGGDILMTRNARLEEAAFEVFILPPRPRNYAYLGSLVKCFLKKPETTYATIVKADRVVVRGKGGAAAERAVWVELDGEVVGTLPMTFEVVADALSVIVP